MEKIKLSEIKEAHLQRDPGNLEELKASIKEIGLINPITLNQNKKLLAGRRRFQAIKELGWKEVDCRILSSEKPLFDFKVSIDENLHSKPLTDIERSIAIKEYHDMKVKLEGQAPDGNPHKRLNSSQNEQLGWSMRGTAEDLGISLGSTNQSIQIATAIEEDPKLASLEGKDILKKLRNRKKIADKEKIIKEVEKSTKEITNSKEIIQQYESGLSKIEIAKAEKVSIKAIDTVLNKIDPEIINFTPEINTVWQWDKPRDKRYGVDHPGAIPAILVQNVLYYFTRPGDHILDPFAGGGITIDVTKDMVNRTVEAFDLHPVRKDIIQHNLLLGPPKIQKEPDFIFLDPPYGPQKVKEYSSSNKDLANIKTKDFLDSMETIFSYWKKGKICVLMSSSKKENQYVDLPVECAIRLQKTGWKLIEHIVNPVYRPTSENGIWIEQAKRYKFLLRKHIHIIIGEKNG